MMGFRVNFLDHAILIKAAEFDRRNLQYFLMACALDRAREILKENGVDVAKIKPQAKARRGYNRKKGLIPAAAPPKELVATAPPTPEKKKSAA